MEDNNEDIKKDKKELCSELNQSGLRRLVFAASTLPPDTPNLWEIVALFVSKIEFVTPSNAQTQFENLKFFHPAAVVGDNSLFTELMNISVRPKSKSLGIVLISPNKTCKLCGSSLLSRADRPSQITIYTLSRGTINGTHYRKICSKFRSGCSFVQHYGHYSKGKGQEVFFDEDWQKHTYFLSTRETAFELDFLRQFDAELLIGQISYNQRADIYNYINNCETIEKKNRHSTR